MNFIFAFTNCFYNPVRASAFTVTVDQDVPEVHSLEKKFWQPSATAARPASAVRVRLPNSRSQQDSLVRQISKQLTTRDTGATHAAHRPATPRTATPGELQGDCNHAELESQDHV
jgi:hypothetical protein